LGFCIENKPIPVVPFHLKLLIVIKISTAFNLNG
jgi:hypothetical protein